jgi:glycosyltransferase involved in cell wall biosynthesis
MISPTVTVLMPVFNAARYLDEAVDSLLSQTFGDFELLAVDDGSTDQTVALLEQRNDPRIRVARLPRNQGIVAALNLGLREARGEYIARMDADDIAEPERLFIQKSFLDMHPDIGVCGSDFIPFGEHAGASSWIDSFSPDEIAIALLFGNPICHPTVMIRRSAIGTHTYPTDYPHAEEFALWAQLRPHTKLTNIPDRLLRYRVHPDQISRRKTDEQSHSMNRIVQQQLKALGLNPSKRELRLHAALGHAFHPRPGLDCALRRWIDRLCESNTRTRLYPDVLFKTRLEQRRVETVLRINQTLASMPGLLRMKWRLLSWWRGMNFTA